MAKQRKSNRGLKPHRVDVPTSDDDSERMNRDRYNPSMGPSGQSEDGSHDALESVASDQGSDSNDDFSTGTSFATESEASSLLDLATDTVETDEILENDELDAASFESRPSVVGGWLDLACGWMDRPNMCIGAMGPRKQTSLLRESKLKASSAMRSVKVNDVLSQAARTASTKEARGLAEVQKLQRDVSLAAEAAANACKKEEVQNVPKKVTKMEHSSKSDDVKKEKMKTDESREITHQAGIVQAQKTQKLRKQKVESNVSQISEYAPDDEIQAKMYEVSVRAAEILKNTIEARSIKPKAEETRDVELSHNDLRQKVIDTLTEVREADTQASDIESTTEQEQTDGELALTISDDAVKGIQRDSVGLADALLVQKLAVRREKSDSNVNTGDFQMPEDEDIVFTRRAPADQKESPPPEKTSSKHAITDLTHIEEESGAVSSSASRSNTPSKRTRLLPMKKPVLGKKEVEVIDVLELDDDDSWTPGEKKDRNLSRSRRDSSQRHRAEKKTDPMPSDRTPSDISPSKQSSFLVADVKRMEIERHVINLWEEEAQKLHEKPIQSDQKAPRDESFNDPLATETFADLRRGRLGTKGQIQERIARSKSISQHHRTLHPVSDSAAEVVTNASKRRSKSIGARRQPEAIDAELTLENSRGREGMYANMPLDLRRRALTAKTSANTEQAVIDNWDTDSRRSTRSRSLVSVRSIDEAQRLRIPRNRDLNDLTVHPSKSREQSDVMHYGLRQTSSREKAINIHQYLESKSHDQQDATNRVAMNRAMVDTRVVSPPRTRSQHQRYESHERRSPVKREQERYSSVVINHSKIRDSSYDFAEVADISMNTSAMGKPNRNASKRHDMRDDSESMYQPSRRDPAGHAAIHPYEESKSKRRERSIDDVASHAKESRKLEKSKRRERSIHGESEHAKELRKLEKKITKQLKQVQQDHGQPKDWDERSVVSSRHLRKLEKHLVQTLRNEEEKRGTKLKRLRNRKTSNRPVPAGMDNPTPVLSHPEPVKQNESIYHPEKMRPEPETHDEPIYHTDTRSKPMKHSEPVYRNISSSKGIDFRETRTKYDQLKVLRQSRPMHKYMQRSHSRSNERERDFSHPEAY